jgi:mycofactocin system glycosyltransferase
MPPHRPFCLACGVGAQLAWKTRHVSDFMPLVPTPPASPVPEGTKVRVDEDATFIDRDLVSGGSPWRLLRLRGPSRAIVEGWRQGAPVRAGEERFARTLVEQGLIHPQFDTPLSRDEIQVVIPLVDQVAALSSLLVQLQGYEVLVVDDGSADGEAVARCVRDYGASLHRIDINRGPAHARNVGVQATTRKFIWFIDVDVSLDDADRVARHLQSAFSDPLVAAVAPRVRGADGPSPRDHFEYHFGPLDMGAKSALVVPGAAVSYVPSACLMVRREAVGDGFDEAMRTGEDVDFVWRLHDQGWLVRYDAGVEVAHRARATWHDWWQQRVRYGASSADLAKRHGKRLAPLRADTWTVVAWSSVLIGRPAAGARIVSGARRHARQRLFSSEENPDVAADQVVTRNMVRAGGPLARATVRTFGVVLLLSAVHPRLRARALGLFAVGSAWRWRHEQFHPTDVPFALVDDLAYGTGVLRGALRARSLRTLTPDITKSNLGLREILGLPDGSPRV